MQSFEASKYEYYRWAKFQWEFMRRSPLFDEIYHKFLKGHKVPSPYVDPSLTFDEIINNYQKDYPGIIGIMLAMQRILPSSVTHSYDAKILKIEIDFEQVNSIKSLKKYINDLIDGQCIILKRLNPNKNKKKRNMADFDRILQAGDLYEDLKKKKKRGIYPKIAAVLYPKDSDRRAAEVKASQRVEEYKKLINGGFFDLVYP